MKKCILLFIFILITPFVYAQTGALNFYINFDKGDSMVRYHWFGDSTTISDTGWVYIDTVNYPGNKWQIGKPQKTVFNSAYSVPNAIVTDTLLPCAANDTSVFILKIPKAAWLGLNSFNFRYKLDIDTGDKAIIEASLDSGAHWYALSDTNSLFTYSPSTIDPGAATTTWQDISLYPHHFGGMDWYNGLLYIRFTLMTGGSTTPRDGWMIDDFQMGYDGEGVADIRRNSLVQISPIPAVSVIDVSYTGRIYTLSVINSYGQTVRTTNCNDEHVKLDVSALPSGPYLLRVNNAATRQFIKQ